MSLENTTASTVANATATLYWEKVLTVNWRNPIQLHVIVPTILVTCLHAYNPLDHPERNALEHESGTHHTQCCICQKSIVKQVSMVGFRCIMTKEALHVDRDFVMYRCAFINCLICTNCAPKTDATFKADHNMINGVVDQFHSVVKDLNGELFAVDMHVSLFFKCIMNRMHATHGTLIKFFGALQSNCMNCKKAKAKWICSACQLNHYCNKTCMKRDWHVHKEECKFYRHMCLFLRCTNSQEFVHIKIK